VGRVIRRSPLAAAGDLGNRIEGLSVRSFGVDCVIADVLSITIVICRRLHYRNVTAHLRQVYDFPELPGLSSSLDERGLPIVEGFKCF